MDRGIDNREGLSRNTKFLGGGKLFCNFYEIPAKGRDIRKRSFLVSTVFCKILSDLIGGSVESCRGKKYAQATTRLPALFEKYGVGVGIVPTILRR